MGSKIFISRFDEKLLKKKNLSTQHDCIYCNVSTGTMKYACEYNLMTRKSRIKQNEDGKCPCGLYEKRGRNGKSEKIFEEAVLQ